tara:strand:+ start:333 stop:605 length:273 start_codon:yes stop_codon:yes gene_type:complete
MKYFLYHSQYGVFIGSFFNKIAWSFINDEDQDEALLFDDCEIIKQVLIAPDDHTVDQAEVFSIQTEKDFERISELERIAFDNLIGVNAVV